MQQLVDSSFDFDTAHQYYHRQCLRKQLIPDHVHVWQVNHSHVVSDFASYLPGPTWIAHSQCHPPPSNYFTMYELFSFWHRPLLVILVDDQKFLDFTLQAEFCWHLHRYGYPYYPAPIWSNSWLEERLLTVFTRPAAITIIIELTIPTFLFPSIFVLAFSSYFLSFTSIHLCIVGGRYRLSLSS
jgi:hypothetical protein